MVPVAGFCEHGEETWHVNVREESRVADLNNYFPWNGDSYIFKLLSTLNTDKGKAIPLQAWTGPEGFRKVEAPRISRQSTHERGKVVSSTNRPPLPPRKYSWYSFLLEAELTPGDTVRLEGLCR
jgi:hypothetical protein